MTMTLAWLFLSPTILNFDHHKKPGKFRLYFSKVQTRSEDSDDELLKYLVVKTTTGFAFRKGRNWVGCIYLIDDEL